MAATTSPVTQPTQPTVSPIIGVIQSSQLRDPSHGSVNHLLDFLAKGNKIVRPGCCCKPKGWFRRDEAHQQGIEWNNDEGGKTPHLTADKNKMLYKIKQEMDVVMLKYGSSRPNTLTLHADLMHAFGVSKFKVQTTVNQYIQASFSGERKKRSDTGQTVFNSQQKRDSEITPYFYYKKLQRMRHKNMVLSEDQIAAGFKTLSASVLRECENGAKSLKGIMTDIHGEIKRVMQQSNGNVSWKRLAILIAGGEDQVQPVGHMTLGKKFMSRDDFRYVFLFEECISLLSLCLFMKSIGIISRYCATQTLPQCTTKKNKNQRKQWSVGCHRFWEGAKLVSKKTKKYIFHC